MTTEFRYRVGGWPDEWCVVRVVDDALGLADLGHWLDARRDAVDPVALDAETNALDPWQHGFRTRAVQVADEAEAWVVLADALTPAGRVLLGDLVRGHPRFSCHYSEVDQRFLCRGLGLMSDPVRWSDPEPHLEDTQALLALYDPRTVTTHNPKDNIDPRVPRPRGLKDTVARLLTPSLQAAEEALHARFGELAPVGHRAGKKRQLRWGFANIDQRDPAYLTYAALDPLCTARLRRLLREGLQARGLWPRALAALREQWYVDGATYLGLPVDEDYARWVDADLAAVAARQAPTLAEHGIKPSGSGPAVGTALQALGATSPKVSRDTGEPSWDREVLEELEEQTVAWITAYGQGRLPTADHAALVRACRGARLLQAVGQARRAGKYRSTWVAPMLWTSQHADGAMHASMRSLGTVTSRMSCQKTETAGPWHSAPKREETRLRACVRAPRGWVVVTADFRQAEPHVMAALSGDPDYLAELRAGDINGVIAADLYPDYVPAEGKRAGTRSYSLRQGVKFAFLAACYGARDRKVDLLLGLPGSGALGRWRSRWPRFWSYSDELNAQRAVRLDSGVVVPLWDRVWVDPVTHELRERVDDMGRPRHSRLGLNAATQGTQADLLKLSVHRLVAMGWKWALRFFLHDEVVGIVPAWMAEAFRADLQAAMTVTYRGVRIECEATIEGPTWGEQDWAASTEAPAPWDDEEAA